jgi:hypothetical protein
MVNTDAPPASGGAREMPFGKYAPDGPEEGGHRLGVRPLEHAMTLTRPYCAHRVRGGISA